VTEPLGGETVVDLELGDRIVKALTPPTVSVSAGSPVQIALDPNRLHLLTQHGDGLLSAAGEPLFTITPTAS
jgi:hypothetical protein